jgi:integrase
MASLKQLTRQQYIRLIETGHVQTIGKHCSLTTIFMVDQIRDNCKHLFELLLTIGQQGGDYGSGSIDSEGDRVFNTSVRQLNYRLENLYKTLFKRAKAKHLGWHASRRWFICELYSSHGPKVASHSVSHHDIKTTMQYVEKSKHLDDIKIKINESVANKLF